MGLIRTPQAGRIAALSVETEDGTILTISGILTAYVATEGRIGATIGGPPSNSPTTATVTFIPTRAERLSRRRRGKNGKMARKPVPL